MLLREYAVEECLLCNLTYLMSLHYVGKQTLEIAHFHLNAGFCFARKTQKHIQIVA